MAMFRRPTVVLALTALWLVPSPLPRGLRAQGTDPIPAERGAARQWFRDAKLGGLIPGGASSCLGQGGGGRRNARSPSGPYRGPPRTSTHVKFMSSQLTELLSGYGPIGGIWFDGMWDKPDAEWRLPRTYALIHRLQPAALIVPNHHRAPLPGEDVQTFEQDLPGANSAGFNTKEIGSLPLETSLTMNNSWGFNITDRRFKSVRELIGYLVRAAGSDANLLLNIGPRPDGTIQPEAVERLRDVGRWLGTYEIGRAHV